MSGQRSPACGTAVATALYKLAALGDVGPERAVHTLTTSSSF